ncbi:MAG: sulfite exporter TauE/SafE family protein [Gemmatimonadales bacterium]
MTTFSFTALVALSSVGAGLIGSLTGLGGGIILVPLLTLVFGVNVRYAAGASLVSVIATSSGAAASYVRDGFANLRLGMLLEIATTLGAVAGAVLAGRMSARTIELVFGGLLLYSAFRAATTDADSRPSEAADPIATRLRLDSSLPGPDGPQRYTVHRVPLGFSLMAVAGVLSGLLGVGSGAVKVLAMDQAMRLPLKVSTTTSNFMIGVTAAASAGVYLRHGYIDPALAFPVVLGVLTGALVGARLLPRVRVSLLRRVFGIAIAALAIEMVLNGLQAAG